MLKPGLRGGYLGLPVTHGPSVGRPLNRRCPVCGAAPGWRCIKTIGQQRMPMTKIHPERRTA